jgi:hypothetical protein
VEGDAQQDFARQGAVGVQSPVSCADHNKLMKASDKTFPKIIRNYAYKIIILTHKSIFDLKQ